MNPGFFVADTKLKKIIKNTKAGTDMAPQIAYPQGILK